MGKGRKSAKTAKREPSANASEGRHRLAALVGEPGHLGHAWIAAAVVASTCLVAYWLTRGTSPYWQDSGLFLAALRSGGGLLSPGYPVYLLLGRPFVALFRFALPGATFAEAGNFFSSVWAALAAGVTALSIATVLEPGYRFFGVVTPRDPASVIRRDPDGTGPEESAGALAALIGGLLAGLSYSLWFQALTAEAYALNAFFAALVLLLFLKLGAEGPLGPSPTRRQRTLVLLLTGAYGLSCGNHPVTVVFLPAFAWLAWTQRTALRDRRLAASAALTWAIAALLPYLYLPWAARAYPKTPFGDVTSLPALVRHMLGVQWSGQEESFGMAPDRFAALPQQLWHELFAAGLVGLLLGLAWLWTRQRLLLGFFALVALPATVLPLVYLRGGEYDFWLLPLYLLAVLVAGVGIGRLLLWLGSRRPRPARLALAAVVAVATLVWPLAVNPGLVSRRGDFVAEDFGRNLYHPLRPGALLVVTSDQENALTQYLEVVEGLRPDVARVDAGSIATPWYAATLRLRYPDLDVPPAVEAPGLAVLQRVEALVLANFRRRPAYVTGLPTFAPPAGAEWVPAGGLWRLSPSAGETARREDWDFAYRNPRPFDRPARDHAPQKLPDGTFVREPYTAQVRRFHVQAWKNLGDFSLDRERFDLAADAYRRAFETDPALDHPGMSFSLGKALFLLDRNAEALPYLERASGRLDTERNAESALYLGQILATKGDQAGARAQFEAARSLVPEMWPGIEASLRQKGFLLP